MSTPTYDQIETGQCLDAGHDMAQSLREQVGGVKIVLGSKAEAKRLLRITLSTAQSAAFLQAIEQKRLIEQYLRGDIVAAVERAGEILCQTFTAIQVKRLRESKYLTTVEGLKPGARYQPVSYAGIKMGRVDDLGTALAALFAEAVLNVRGQVPVRVPGVHDKDDPSHYVSIVTQVKGQEKKLTSGSLQDFGWHGDSDGYAIRIIDDLVLVGQIADQYFQPTLYSDIDAVRAAIKRDARAQRHIEILRQPKFVSEQPGYADRADMQLRWSIPVIQTDGSLVIHPSTKPHDQLTLGERSLAERALAWLRMALSETAIGVHLEAFQLLVVPNRHGKHAVWAKNVQMDGLTRRQFVRVYGTASAREPGKHFVTAPLI